MKTFQKLSLTHPLSENRNIGLTLGCGNCGTIRTFKIDSNMLVLQNREGCGFGVETECEKYGHLIGAFVSWIDANQEGYSYKKLDGGILHDVQIVEDDNGLRDVK